MYLWLRPSPGQDMDKQGGQTRVLVCLERHLALEEPSMRGLGDRKYLPSRRTQSSRDLGCAIVSQDLPDAWARGPFPVTLSDTGVIKHNV